MGISDAAESLGFRTMGVRIEFKALRDEAILPCIVHWQENHFLVVYKIEREFPVCYRNPGMGKKSQITNLFILFW